jgi:FtsX-like permease family/MacB-like periplasmic core domain
LSSVLRGIRYSVRSLARSPGLTLALLFTIALGVGSNVTIYGFVQGLTARNIPRIATGRVVSLFGRDAHGAAGPISYEDYLSLKRQRDVFEWIGAARISQNVVTLAGPSEILPVAAVTPDLARLFKIPLDKGVVISHRVWQDELGGKAGMRGEQVRIGDAGARVAGVAPDWLEGVYSYHAIDLWMTLRDQPPETGRIRNLWVLAGLRPGVRAGRIGAGQIHAVPYTGMAPEMAEGVARVSTLLRAAAGFAFFIACANVASLLLGRAVARSYETSLRVALGASRGRLAGAVLSDSLAISVAGGALGALLAVWTSEVIPALLFQPDAELLVTAPRAFSTVVASAAGAAVIIACGLLPLFETPQDRPAAVLGRESAGPSKASRAVRAVLVIAQMACCCLLVICTGFLYEGFHTALRTSASHRLGQPILATVQPHPDVEVDLKYFRDVEHAARSVAGVGRMAWAGRLPGSPPVWRSFRVEPAGLPLREVKMDVAAFTADSLELFSLPPKAGRLFGFVDQTCRVAIVNEAGAGVLFGGATVGRSIQDPTGMPVVIIGVVAARNRAAQKSRPTIYYNDTDQTGLPSNRIEEARFRAPVASRLETAELDANVVSPGYFNAMGLSLLAGRIFPDDRTAHGCRAAVVNREAADLYFGGKAIGSAVIDDMGRRTEIIGAVRSAQLGAFQRHAEPAIYFPMAQDCLPRMTLILGARNASDRMVAEVRRTLESVPDRGPGPLLVETLDTYLSRTALAPLRIATVMVGASATTALLLGVIGLYGALSDAARERGRELAIRIALGARRRHVIGHVLREAGQLAGAGTLAGVLGALFLSPLLLRIVPTSGSPKLWLWIAGPVMLAGAAAIASVIPARRALMVNPLSILRNRN